MIDVINWLTLLAGLAVGLCAAWMDPTSVIDWLTLLAVLAIGLCVAWLDPTRRRS